VPPQAAMHRQDKTAQRLQNVCLMGPLSFK
jgi:hypothetical protein